MTPSIHAARRHGVVRLLTVLVALAWHASAQQPTISLSTYTAFDVQRTCVKQCLIGPHNNGSPGVIKSLGCSGSPMLEACYCQTAMAASVSAGMTACINSYCGSKTADLSAALSLYDTYCAGSLSVQTKAATVSLATDAKMAAQRTCVQGCMMSRPVDGGTNLPWALQCTASPAYNDCLCRPDLSTDANTFLTECVNKYCTGEAADISSAVSIYGSYCLAARQAAPTGAGGGNNGGDGGQANPGGSTANSQPTETGAGRNDGKSGNNGGVGDGSGSTGAAIGAAAIGGIIAGIAVLLIACAAGVWFCCRRSRRRAKPAPIPMMPEPKPSYTYPPTPPSEYNAPNRGLRMAPSSSSMSTEQNVSSWLEGQGPRRAPSVAQSRIDRDDHDGVTDILSQGRW